MISGIDYGKGNDGSCTITFVSPEYIKELEEENRKLQQRFNNLVEEYKDKAEYTHNLIERIDKAIKVIENDTDLNSQRQRKRLVEILGGNDE